MKLSNNALNFLLAQYRAIFKRAYVKGLASAVILTAGLAAGQAQAALPFYSNTGYVAGDWTPQETQNSTSGLQNVAGGIEVSSGTTIKNPDGTLNGNLSGVMCQGLLQ